MHTCFSADSEATVTSMLDAAVEKGLEGVCITDHMDLDFPETPDFPANAFQFDLDEYFGQLNRLKEQYKGKLDLRIGVEIGLQKHLGEAYHRLTEAYPFDFVIDLFIWLVDRILIIVKSLKEERMKKSTGWLSGKYWRMWRQ